MYSPLKDGDPRKLNSSVYAPRCGIVAKSQANLAIANDQEASEESFEDVQKIS